MHQTVERGATTARSSRAVTGLLILLFLACGQIPLSAETTAAPDRSILTMNQYVLIFREGPRQLPPEIQKRRAEEVRAWARQQVTAGANLDARVLGAEKHDLSPEGIQASAHENEKADGNLVAIVFLVAPDFSAAVKMAESHPGLRYGVSVEVRPWTAPVAPLTTGAR